MKKTEKPSCNENTMMKRDEFKAKSRKSEKKSKDRFLFAFLPAPADGKKINTTGVGISVDMEGSTSKSSLYHDAFEILISICD